jgi:hypothetical protein
MFRTRTWAAVAFAASLATLVTSIVVADDYKDRFDHERPIHLDLWDARRNVRKLEEKNDILQDHLADWISQRRDDREHHAADMIRYAEHIDQNLAQLKIDLYHHQEPWELRDNTRDVIDITADFGHSIARGDWHDEFQHEWEDMRDSANELARQFHIPEIDH